MDPRIESELEELRQFLTNNLSAIKSKFGPKSKKAWENTLTTRLPNFAEVKEVVGVWEEKTSPVNWDDLPAWIDNAVESFRSQYKGTVRLYEAMGLPASDAYSSPDDDIEKIKQKIALSPCGQALRRWLGPNWMSCPDINGMQSLNTLQTPVLSDRIVLDAISKRTRKILAYWEDLKATTASWRLEKFRVSWDRLTTDERREHLRQSFPQLHETAQAEIYAWVRSPKSRRSKIDPRLFMTPILNIKDLCMDETLPNLLESRVKWHPGLFRAVDGRSVLLGQHCGSLSLAMPGHMIFASGRSYQETGLYNIGYAKDLDPIQACSPYNTNASRGILQLEAQCRTYGFLAACLERLPVAPDNDNIRPHSGNEQPLSLLARASLLDFGGSPEIVDLNYLAMLLASSRDQAMDDLEQLRSDPDSFIDHWHMTSQQGPGRIVNFLQSVFQRIDTFQSLANLLDAVKQLDPTESDTADSLTTSDMPDLMSLHTALQSSLDDTVSSLKALSYSPASSDHSVFGKLFDMVKECDPIVWIMGLPSVMLVIDRELQNTEKVNIPLAVMQAVNDIAVLAVCLRETWKQFNFGSGLLSSIHEVNKLEMWWKQQPRPWLSLAEGGCAAMDSVQSRTLENYTRRRDLESSDRLRTFWNTIDHCMASSTTDTKILEFIQQRAPIDSASTIQSSSWAEQSSLAVTPTITRTKTKRSKGQQPQLTLPPSQLQIASSATANNAQPAPTKPRFKVKASTFSVFSLLFSRSSAARGSIRWDAFVAAMTDVGFSVIPKVGSIYMFVPPENMAVQRICILHRPHKSSIEGVVLLIYSRRLKGAYGWDDSTFVLI
jgi:hypothetical protein